MNPFLPADIFYSTLVDSSIDAIIATDMSGKITAWNRAAEIIYGRTREEAIDSHLKDIIAGVGDDAAGMHALGLAFSGFKSFVPADRSIPYRNQTETHYLPLLNKKNEQVGVMQITHDVAHRIKAERGLEELNRKLNSQNRQLERAMDEMASFTQISSNNIKAPIRNLYTDVEFLIKGEAKSLSDSGKATFRRMQSSLNKMNLLLDDLLQLSEISVAKPVDKIDLDDVLKSVSAKLENKVLEKNALLEIGNLCTVAGHRELLEKLFYHLLDNAVKFNESKKPIIKVSCEELAWVPPTDGAAGNYYRVSIEDDGIGMGGQDIEKAFTLFEKVHGGNYKGSGLGLALARKIMHMHNGFISIESTERIGIVCTCWFPVEQE